MLTEHAPAKLNLALHLRRRRDDGYHDLETVFAFTDFGDTLAMAPAAGLSLAVTGDWAAAAGPGPDNLVLRAARALAAAARRDVDAAGQGAALTLAKHIPVAAGLGGGSADAAAALRLLNRAWRLDWPAARLVELAADLGSDVPACVASRTCFGAGRGEILADWPVAVAAMPVLLVNPRVAVPTGPVFAGWDQQDHGGITAGAPFDSLRNDMTAAAIIIAPVIATVLAALDDAGGASVVRMSGSGATCFALYADDETRDAAAVQLSRHGWWQARSCLR